mmetsp:Transcript_45704/g.118588  ORF Transcript_45704/g.118588 Transcript_45704/m.118588 type:complete len:426 (+) Transcript_45704:376-1653(+)
MAVRFCFALQAHAPRLLVFLRVLYDLDQLSSLQLPDVVWGGRRDWPGRDWPVWNGLPRHGLLLRGLLLLGRLLQLELVRHGDLSQHLEEPPAVPEEHRAAVPRQGDVALGAVPHGNHLHALHLGHLVLDGTLEHLNDLSALQLSHRLAVRLQLFAEDGHRDHLHEVPNDGREALLCQEALAVLVDEVFEDLLQALVVGRGVQCLLAVGVGLGLWILRLRRPLARDKKLDELRLGDLPVLVGVYCFEQLVPTQLRLCLVVPQEAQGLRLQRLHLRCDLSLRDVAELAGAARKLAQPLLGGIYPALYLARLLRHPCLDVLVHVRQEARGGLLRLRDALLRLLQQLVQLISLLVELLDGQRHGLANRLLRCRLHLVDELACGLGRLRGRVDAALHLLLHLLHLRLLLQPGLLTLGVHGLLARNPDLDP